MGVVEPCSQEPTAMAFTSLVSVLMVGSKCKKFGLKAGPTSFLPGNFGCYYGRNTVAHPRGQPEPPILPTGIIKMSMNMFFWVVFLL